MMNDKLREAAQAALEWLRDELLDTWADMDRQFYKDCAKHTKALEAALAEPAIKESLTAQRPWVGLTHEDMADTYNSTSGDVMMRLVGFARAIEAKLREKNT